MTEAAAAPTGDARSSLHTVLSQARTENFPVAPRWLPRDVRRRLMDVYGFARFVDDAGDEARGDRLALLDEIEPDLERVFGGTPELPVMRSLQRTVSECGIPPEPLRRLIQANRVDQTTTRYATFDDLLTYCELSANPVGHLVLYVFKAFEPARAVLSDHVCSALQVIEHIQDAGEDYRRGRVYMPQADFEAIGAEEADLAESSAPPRLRTLLELQNRRAENMLRNGSRLTGQLSGWARIAVAGFVGGGLAQVAALRRARHDVLAHQVKAGGTAVVTTSLWVCARGRA